MIVRAILLTLGVAAFASVSVPVEAGTTRTRTAPFDYGCISRMPNSIPTPCNAVGWERARNGNLDAVPTPDLCYYGFFVVWYPCVRTNSTYLGIDTTELADGARLQSVRVTARVASRAPTGPFTPSVCVVASARGNSMDQCTRIRRTGVTIATLQFPQIWFTPDVLEVYLAHGMDSPRLVPAGAGTVKITSIAYETT